VNNGQRDKLPTRDLVLARKDAIIHSWSILDRSLPGRFRREAARLVGVADIGADWQAPLYSAFAEAVEYTASLRGVDRWAPSMR
jgi:hypothetical protein